MLKRPGMLRRLAWLWSCSFVRLLRFAPPTRNDYWSNVNTFEELVSALLATLPWPLLLLGINLHIH
jgi:hypothetical protein